jgi:hypothetical protein
MALLCVGFLALVVLVTSFNVWLQKRVARDIERRGGNADELISGLWDGSPRARYRYYRLRRKSVAENDEAE